MKSKQSRGHIGIRIKDKMGKKPFDDFFNELSNILIFVIFNRDAETFDYIEQNINGILSSAREKLFNHIEAYNEIQRSGYHRKDT